jgi:asparagine synthase (glutamine-hydrolysing)
MLESGLFDPAGIARLLDEHQSGRFDHAQVIWLLLAFEGFLAALTELPCPAVPAEPAPTGA